MKIKTSIFSPMVVTSGPGFGTVTVRIRWWYYRYLQLRVVVSCLLGIRWRW